MVLTFDKTIKKKIKGLTNYRVLFGLIQVLTQFGTKFYIFFFF